MGDKEKNILYKDLEIPAMILEKADEVFARIQKETEEEKAGSNVMEKLEKEKFVRKDHEKGRFTDKKQGRQPFHLPAAAVVLIIVFVISGTSATAMGISSLYRQRMESMGAKEKEELYTQANAGETDSFSRPLSAGESSRLKTLIEEYEKNGLFPDQEMAVLDNADAYKGRGVAVDGRTRTIYLPDGTLNDEELLEIIDYEHKIRYAIYDRYQEQMLAKGTFESRMAGMTDEEVDKIYLAYCAANLETGSGFSRQFSPSENERYEVLKEKYEKDCLYPEADLEILETLTDYTGDGVAFCKENCGYCIHDGELSDEEMLQIIDFNHKIDYCFSRLADEIQMGLRNGYPVAE